MENKSMSNLSKDDKRLVAGYLTKTYKADEETAIRTFVQYFSLAMALMRMSKHNLEMASAFCHNTRPKIKRTLDICAKAQDVRIQDACLLLKNESKQDMFSDLSGEALQCIDNILHELMLAENIVDIESELIDLIRKSKLSEVETLKL